MTPTAAEIVRLRPYLAAPPYPPPAAPGDPFRGATAWTAEAAVRRVERALAALGSTSRGVARRLAALGCVGDRDSVCNCPLAAYLRRQGLGAFRVSVLAARVVVAALDGWEEDVAMPPACAFFRGRFDRGEFADLATPGAAPVPFGLPDWDAAHAAAAAAEVTA